MKRGVGALAEHRDSAVPALVRVGIALESAGVDVGLVNRFLVLGTCHLCAFAVGALMTALC